MDEPEEIDKLCRKLIQDGRENLARLSAAGLDAAYSGADMADNRGPFFSPEQMQRFILPYLAEWTAAAKSQGIYPILHTDGNISLLLEDLAATGICAVQAIDPVAGMDIRAVKAQMGNRLCLCGNVDCGELILATPEKLYDSTRSLLADCKPGGCFVLGASNAVVDMTPKENYDAVLQAWQDSGAY
jgi:uroporphyrinogen decarboxylase